MTIINIFTLSAPESDVYRRQTLTYKDGPWPERVNDGKPWLSLKHKDVLNNKLQCPGCSRFRFLINITFNKATMFTQLL